MKWILPLSLFLSLSCNNNEICKNGAINSPKCDQCSQGKIFMEGQCAILVAPPHEVVEDPGYPRK